MSDPLKNDALFSVADQVVLVSGGSRGIGRALAAGFAARNARVIITGREQMTLDETAQAISTGAYPVATRVCDVSDTTAIDKLVPDLEQEFGRIDTLINVAGVNIRKKMETYTPAEYDHIVDINLRGLFFLCQRVGQGMIARKSGNIISIDSLNSRAPLLGVLPYAISKGGVSILTRGLANEWGQHNIRVNAIAPGFILTDLTQKLWSDEKMQAWGIPNTPLRRLGRVEDLVGAALFMASSASAFMTGQVVYVDGGITAGMNWPIPL